MKKKTCLKLSISSNGRVIDVRLIKKNGSSSYNLEMNKIFILQKHEIKVWIKWSRDMKIKAWFQKV